MGRTPVALVCLVAFAGAGALAGCQPLYGGKPEHLKTPEKRRHPAEPDAGSGAVVYVDACQSDQHGPAPRTRQTGIANQLVSQGDQSLAQSQHATDPASAGGFVKDAIDKYRNALVKDPYDIDATLKLAEAYDLVLRKGCALAMLRRIGAMEAHPNFQHEANTRADEVNENPALFKGYRKDAVAAVGR